MRSPWWDRCITVRSIPGSGAEGRPGGGSIFGHVAGDGSGAFTDQGSADADEGGTFLHSHFEVAAHAHAEDGQGGAQEILGTAGQIAAAAEGGAGAFGDGAVGGHAHEAMDFESGEGVQFLQFGQEGFRGVTELGGFTGHIDLDEDGQGTTEGIGTALQLKGEAEAVHALDAVKGLGGFAGFVGLEMADEVPFEVGGGLGDFGSGFLDAVFAEEPDPEIGQSADGGDGVIFGDRHQADLGGGAVGALAGVVEASLDYLEVCGKVHVAIVLLANRGGQPAVGWVESEATWRNNPIGW